MGERLLFRTRGGPEQGWGNVYRLASFAGACRERGHEDALFLAEGPPAVHAFLRARGFRVESLPEGCALEVEEARVAELGPFDLAVVEMLDVTCERQLLLGRHARRVAVFDDLCDHVYDADLVVCGQSLPSFANRRLSSGRTRFLVGPEYFLCRPEFLRWADEPRVHAAGLGHVLVLLGGGRYDVGWIKAARALREVGLDGTFVLGPDAPPSLAARLRGELPGARLLGHTDDVPGLLRSCDAAIVSAGYAKLEAAVTRTPAIMLSVQWHQIPLAQAFSEQTGMADAGYMAYVEPMDLAAELAQLAAPEARLAAAERARAVVDGRGMERVYDALFSSVAC